MPKNSNDEATSPYTIEYPHRWGEFPDWIQWGAEHNCLGYGDLDGCPGEFEWICRVNPTYLRQFAELLEFAYGYETSRGTMTGSVPLALGRREDGKIIGLAAREHDEATDGLVVMTRIDPRRDE